MSLRVPRPGNLASLASLRPPRRATLDQLVRRPGFRVNVVSGKDKPRGDTADVGGRAGLAATPRDQRVQRIERLKRLSSELDRDLPPLEFGLRITTFVRDTTEQAWADAEAKVAEMADAKRPAQTIAGTRRGPEAPAGPAVTGRGAGRQSLHHAGQVRRRRRGHHLAGRFAAGRRKLAAQVPGLGVSHFVLSDTPYLEEIKRQGDQLLPLLRG